MKVLAIDTTTMISSCTILEDDQIIGDYSVNQEKTHSEALLPMIQELLYRLGMSIQDIDLYAVTVGPGSFTGIRIGMTTAKTLAQVNDKPLVGVSTLRALALGVFSDRVVVPLIDARGKRVYYGVYQTVQGKLQTLKEDAMCKINELGEILSAYQNPIFVGDGVSHYRKELQEISMDPALPHFNYAIGKNIAVLAKQDFEEQPMIGNKNTCANYIALSQAQRDFKHHANK